MNITRLDNRPEIERGLAKYRILDEMNFTAPETALLVDFTIEALNVYGSETTIEEANKVGDVILQILKKKKLIQEGFHQTFVDVLLCSALLHNLFFDSSKAVKDAALEWENIFTARRILEPRAWNMGIERVVTDAIFTTIESQLGEDTPVTVCIAKPNTPTELFATACWVAKEYIIEAQE